MYGHPVFADFHFMFCIDESDGQPVFIQQMGHYDPKVHDKKDAAPVLITVGMTSITPAFDVPALVYVKRCRK